MQSRDIEPGEQTTVAILVLSVCKKAHSTRAFDTARHRTIGLRARGIRLNHQYLFATAHMRARSTAMITQLNPPLPLETSKGPGLAHFVIDYGPESHLLWVVFLDEGGACWTVPNPEIRIQSNWSLRRREKVATA